MADRDELDKLFDAALHGRKAPSRFGTPEEHVKAAPAAFMKAPTDFQKANDDTASPFKADSSEQSPFVPFVAEPSQSTGPEVVLDEKSLASLDDDTNAEFQEIINKKIAKERSKRRRDRVIFYVLLIGVSVGGAGWFLSDPGNMKSFNKILAEIRLAVDPTAVAEKYDKSLEKVAERGDQLGEAAGMIGGKEVEGEDQSLDEEMKKIAGDEAGLSVAEKQKKLKEKFDSLQNKKTEEGN